ncbi:MAG: hypothetical protein FJZ96_10185 [Chloroflexi bacterium]|nr:hypothetical protein [Chloroflexota bacterium]
MNIYFACSITGGREFVDCLLEAGCEAPTAHLAEASAALHEATVSGREVYERDVAWISACDVLVAEVSTPSHGVGYEIA